MTQGRLAAKDKDAQAALAAAVHVATRGWAEPQIVVLHGEDGISALHVLSVPRDGSFLREWFRSALAIVLIGSSRPSEPPDPLYVRDLLGLTLGEARVGSIVGWGSSPRQAAERLGIQEETVRSVLKRIYQKTGISRQSELVAIMHRLMLK